MNAQISTREPYAFDASAKDVEIHDFNVVASSTAQGDATGARCVRRSRNEPFTIVGKIDAIRGTRCTTRKRRGSRCARSRTTSPTPPLEIVLGRARNFDARLYSLDVQPNPPSYHVNLQLDLDGARDALSAITAPIEDDPRPPATRWTTTFCATRHRRRRWPASRCA